ncbi:carbohydrate sulfotransferase 10-like [Engraulis encrasicolus]|uniref:carbohydrate sulfotransferase 10-like n=1 Tax=Engraulis encrasicolus TaxID=184585 RepID=UPI002FD15D4C
MPDFRCCEDGPRLVHWEIKRRHWLLVGACGWVLMLLMVASRFINYNLRVPDDYSSKAESRSWPELTIHTVKPQRPALHSNNVSTAAVLSTVPSDWHSVVEKRLDMLAAVCKNSSLRNYTHTPINKFLLDRIFVCDKHKILFCQTPKVGNTQWKKVLIVLNGKYSKVEDIPEPLVHNHKKNGLPRLSSLKENEIKERLDNYFKFFIVRDPFERIISAYKDKFVKNPRSEPWYKHDIAPAIIRKYRKMRQDTEDSSAPRHARGLRFEDFMRYLGDSVGQKQLNKKFRQYVIHWITYVKLCAPCDINYDAVGHHETLDRDAPYILKAAGIDNLVSYPTIPPGITRYNRTKVESYFSGISKRDIGRLYEHFMGDFELFGYPRPDFLLD